MLFVVGSIIKNKKTQLYGHKVFNIFIETAYPGVLLFLLCFIEETPKFLDSPLFLFYFILIVLSSLQLDIKLALLTSVLSAISYLWVTIWAKTIVVGREDATCKNCGEKLRLSYIDVIHREYDCPSCNTTNEFRK